MTGSELYEALWQAKCQQGGPTPLKGYATVYQPLTLDETMLTPTGHTVWNDRGPITRAVDLLPGATVKIVMVSRLGDFGITSHLERDYGYALRVTPDDPRFTDWRLTREVTR
jgi:hypothetical protein